MSMCWFDFDFRPAVPGWRAVYLDENGAAWCQDLAGWLIQAEGRMDEWGGDDDPRPLAERSRQVVAAVLDGPDVIAAGDMQNLWKVIGPSESMPSAAEAYAEHKRRGRVIA